jgi:serine/threonine protein kinase
MVSPTSPLATSPLAMQFIRANDIRVSPDSLPQASIPPVKHMPRPAFRARHSSSVVHSARQTELMSPDRFSTFFSITRTIGQGEFSEAFEVRDRSNDEIYAIKKTKVPLVGHKARLRRLEEVDILRLLSKDAAPSPYIIRMFDAWEQTGNLYIQTELCPFGNLSFFLEEYGRMYEFLDEARVWKILAEVTSGLAYIHQHGVLHLDVKPANIFIAQNGSLKIGDFGLATRWPRVKPITILQGAAIHSPGWDAAAASSVWLSERTRSQSSNDKEASRESMQDLEREGDREYIAPEILRGEYGRPADMFA